MRFTLVVKESIRSLINWKEISSQNMPLRIDPTLQQRPTSVLTYVQKVLLFLANQEKLLALVLTAPCVKNKVTKPIETNDSFQKCLRSMKYH